MHNPDKFMNILKNIGEETPVVQEYNRYWIWKKWKLIHRQYYESNIWCR